MARTKGMASRKMRRRYALCSRGFQRGVSRGLMSEGMMFNPRDKIMNKNIVAGRSVLVKVLRLARISGACFLPALVVASCAGTSGHPSPRVLSAKAHQALLSGDVARAVRLDREALAYSPGDVVLMNNLAVALMRSGKKGEAEAVLQQALIKSPDNPRILLNLARIELTLGEIGSAYRYASRIVYRDHWPGGFRTLMGKIDIDRGDYQEAHIYLHEAQERHPENPLILTYLGIVHYRIGELAESRKNFQSALSLHPPPALARTLHSLLASPERVLGGVGGALGGTPKSKSQISR
ncbi:MAG: tetratricopeptide repeat protein [Leptospirillia bacterium]